MVLPGTITLPEHPKIEPHNEGRHFSSAADIEREGASREPWGSSKPPHDAKESSTRRLRAYVYIAYVHPNDPPLPLEI